MRFDDVQLRAAAVWLPPLVPVSTAAAPGTRMETVAVSTGDAPPEMAARAARSALGRAGQPPAELDLILHASVYYQGVDVWPPPSFVQREVAPESTCPAVEVRQMSNGGMAALELAARTITGRPGSAALVTAADRFCPPGFDRYGTDPGTVYADGGSALVLSSGTPGFARLLSLASHAEAGLEGMHRGDDLFGSEPFALRKPVDMGATTKAFVARHGLPYVVRTISHGTRRSLEQALDEAGVTLGDIDLFVLPHLGRRRLEQSYFRPFGIDPARTTWRWGRRIGHLGAADQFAGLARLGETGGLAAGQLVAVLGMGAGFIWSSAVLRIERAPAWF